MCGQAEVLGGFWMGTSNAHRANLLIFWSHPPGSNWRPADYESAALPTELGWLSVQIITKLWSERRRGFRQAEERLTY